MLKTKSNGLITGRTVMHKGGGGPTTVDVRWTRIGKSTVLTPCSHIARGTVSAKTAGTPFINRFPVLSKG